MERTKVIEILKSKPDLITNQVYEKTEEEIIEVLSLPEWADPKFQKLLTSKIWDHKAGEIKEN